MSMTTSTATPTATQLLSLTTPYISPFNCHVDTERTLTSVIGDNIRLVPYFVSDPADTRFATCQPSGWASVVPESRFSFSPAVCPWGWTAYDIGVTEESSQQVTTAWCCDMMYELYPSSNYPLEGFSKPCSGTRPMGSVSLSLHLPWHISWQKSDLASLTPTPPPVTAGQTISSWVQQWSPPGPTTTAENTHQKDAWAPLLIGLVVGLGVGLPLLICIGCVCCCFSQRRREQGP